jgi:hypothetical protein
MDLWTEELESGKKADIRNPRVQNFPNSKEGRLPVGVPSGTLKPDENKKQFLQSMELYYAWNTIQTR